MTSGHHLFFSNINQNYFFSKQNLYHSLRVVRPGRLYILSVRDRLGSSSDLLKSWGGSVAVACGVRLSCSVFTGVQCVIVRVTCGARYSYSASSTGVQKAGTS